MEAFNGKVTIIHEGLGPHCVYLLILPFIQTPSAGQLTLLSCQLCQPGCVDKIDDSTWVGPKQTPNFSAAPALNLLPRSFSLRVASGFLLHWYHIEFGIIVLFCNSKNYMTCVPRLI